MNAAPPWNDSLISTFPEAPKALDVDVAIIGGGVTGLTAALLALDEGKSVAVLESRRVGGGETLRTTAHLTEVLDTRYYQFISKFGLAKTTLIARSQGLAIQKIETIVHSENIPCDFRRVPGFLFGETNVDRDELEREAGALEALGFSSNLIDSAPLPFKSVRAIRIENQAEFHPGKYLNGLVRAIMQRGGHIFEGSTVISAKDGAPCVLTLEGDRSVTSKFTFVAANVPVTNRVALHLKLAAYRTYAIAFKTAASFAPGLYWDTENPYHYIRAYGGLVIVGGEDHKTGAEVDTELRFAKLVAYARERFGEIEIHHRWSGQVIETPDGLPYLGKNVGSRNIYVATGFSGNGITYGTLGAMLFRDALIDRDSELCDLYAPTRAVPIFALSKFMAEVKDFPIHFACERLVPCSHLSLEELKPGEAAIVVQDGKKVAAYRDSDGRVQSVSAICTHLGCVVHWNPAETTWDCPCHGSRFGIDGTVLNGPAVIGLNRVV